MRPTVNILIFSALVLIQPGCQSPERGNGWPVESGSNSGILPRKPSHLTLPVAVNFSVLEEKANNEIPEKYDEKVVFEEFGVRASHIAFTRSPFHVKPTADGVAIETRISDVSVDCEFLGRSFTTSVDLIAGVQIDPRLAKDWKLHLNAKPYCTILKISLGMIPPACVSMFRGFAARTIVDDVLEPEMSALESEIEEMTIIKDEAAQLLTKFQTSLQINAAPNLWLNVEPLSFYLPELTTQGSNLVCSVGMEAVISTTLAKPGPGKTTILLPLLDKTGEDQLLINGILTGNVDEWEGVMAPLFNELNIPVGRGATVHIKKCRFEQRDAQIAVHLTFTTHGGVMNPKGELVLLGNPVLDNGSHILALESLDYDLHTRHVFAKCADWLLHESIRKRIAEMARYDFSGELDNLQSSLNGQMRKLEICDGLFLEAEMAEIELLPVHMQSRTLSLPYILRGKGKIIIANLNLPM